MVSLQLVEGSQGHGWPKSLHCLSGSENREECWLCFDYGRLYKFQKIDFSRPPWLGMKARRVFIESGPRWLDFWPWPCGQWIQPWMSFVFLLSLQGLTFPDGSVDLVTTALPWALFALFLCFYIGSKLGRISNEQCNDQGAGGNVCPLEFGGCLCLLMVPVTRRLYCLTIMQRVIKEN